MKFTYLAKNNEGGVTKGTIEAAEQKSAEDILEKQGLTPISIQKTEDSQNFFAVIQEKTTFIPLKEKMLFARQLSTLVSAGIPIAQAMQTLKEQLSNKAFKKIISELSADVEGGIALSVSMSKFPRVFSNLFINMVKSGEVGGILDESLERMATELEVEHRMVSQIRGAMIYPIAILTLTAGVIVFMIMYLIPQMTGIFASLGGETPPSMKMLIGMSDFFKNFGILVLIAIIGVIFGIRHLIKKNQKVRFTWHQIILKIPALGQAAKKINISRFTRTLSSLLSSGVTVLEAMQVAADSTNNEVYRTELSNAIEKVKNGSTIAEALGGSKYFPAIVCQTIAVGEETGAIDKILMKLTDYYEEEVTNFTKGISDLILPVIMVIIGIVVGFMFYVVIVPISEISNTIQ